MNEDLSKESTAGDEGAETPQCCPDCKCDSTGLSTSVKAIICLVIAVAVAFFVMRGFARNAGRVAAESKGKFAATVPASSAKSPTVTVTTTKATEPVAWCQPLPGLASLNEVASDKDAVFIYLPEKGKKPQEAVKRIIEGAAAKTASRGMKVSYFTLDTSSKEYAQAAAQVPPPCVVAMVKKGGMAPVSGQITEKKLLEAMVTASRPSSCGPSGCAPSTPGCK